MLCRHCWGRRERCFQPHNVLCGNLASWAGSIPAHTGVSPDLVWSDLIVHQRLAWSEHLFACSIYLSFRGGKNVGTGKRGVDVCNMWRRNRTQSIISCFALLCIGTTGPIELVLSPRAGLVSFLFLFSSPNLSRPLAPTLPLCMWVQLWTEPGEMDGVYSRRRNLQGDVSALLVLHSREVMCVIGAGVRSDNRWVFSVLEECLLRGFTVAVVQLRLVPAFQSLIDPEDMLKRDKMCMLLATTECTGARSDFKNSPLTALPEGMQHHHKERQCCHLDVCSLAILACVRRVLGASHGSCRVGHSSVFPLLR